MRPEKPNTQLNYFEELDAVQKLQHLIHFAIFAPSSHNTQPWLFKVENNRIEITLNLERVLPVSDPQKRQAYLSLGTAVGNIRVAAAHYGYNVEVAYEPSNNGCAVSLIQNEGRLNIPVETIFQRHSNRSLYSEQVPTDFISTIKNFSDSDVTVHVIQDEEEKVQTIKVAGAAIEEALDDHDFRHELSHWIKPSLEKYKDGMPGYNLGMPFLISFIFPLALKVFKLGKVQRKSEENTLRHTPAFVVLSSREDNPAAWMKVGQLFEEIALRAEVAGVKTSLFTAPIQIGEYYKDLQKILNTNNRPQMFFRIGYADSVPKATPRLAYEEVIR